MNSENDRKREGERRETRKRNRREEQLDQGGQRIWEKRVNGLPRLFEKSQAKGKRGLGVLITKKKNVYLIDLPLADVSPDKIRLKREARKSAAKRKEAVGIIAQKTLV